MGGFLQKAVRGAASAGAELSMENYRASAQDKRDKKLQSYQTSERVAGEAHDIKMQKLRNEGAAQGGGRQGDIQLMNYLQDKGLASTPEEAYTLAQQMDTDPTKVILDIAKSMQQSDVSSGMVDQKPFSKYVKEVEGDVSALRERMNPRKKDSVAQPTGGPLKNKGVLNSSAQSDNPIDQMLAADGLNNPSVSTPSQPSPSGGSDVNSLIRIQGDDDYKKLASGTRYIAPDGKTRVKR